MSMRFINELGSRKTKAAAKAFAKKWLNEAGDEKQETARFWIELLNKVFGVVNPEDAIRFEVPVDLSHQSYIDAHLPDTRVVIEQKSSVIDLAKPQRQSDGSMLTPYEQAKRYADNLPFDDRARWIVTCNFREFRIHDMSRRKPAEPAAIVSLQELPEQHHLLAFLVDNQRVRVEKEKQVSMQAGVLISRIYNALLGHSMDKDSADTLQSLNKFCVRLVFCLYAEDAGLFKRDQFLTYISASNSPADLRKRLQELFVTLNRPMDQRDPYDTELRAFPYVNGGLFEDERMFIPMMDENIRNLIQNEASAGFNWKDISPTIFGGLFESTLNPETRRQGGMHYTSIENIHKVIDPLFLNDLKAEFNKIRLKNTKEANKRKRELMALQDKLASLTILDPACGSGNFLTESFISLRRLENDILKEMATLETDTKQRQMLLTKVSIQQFFGIEINDFAVRVAKTALWIADAQMWEETQEILHSPSAFLPLKQYNGIREANALRVDWLENVPHGKLDFIIGNPPFEGAKKKMHPAQREDMKFIFGKMRLVQSLDYVFAWYKKAADCMKDLSCKAAFVSTNSVVQGQQAAVLGKILSAERQLNIIFAHRTFKWDNEAKKTAKVNCVIIGFSSGVPQDKTIYIYDNKSSALIEIKRVNRINCYLEEAQDVHVERRSTPICKAPTIYFGNMSNDSSKNPPIPHQYIFTEEEKDAFLDNEPRAAQFFRPWLNAKDFINGERHYCLWLKGANPNELSKCPSVMKRVQTVREIRLKSTASATRKKAETPTLFFFISHPDRPYLLIPATGSENRQYFPMGFMDEQTIASNACLIIPDATLYHFGVLSSALHMAWIKAVCGRHRSDPRYSNDVVYNNFPWPNSGEKQRKQIEECAQAVLDARTDCSMSALYNPLTMPLELRKAHRALDTAVDKAYGGKRFKNDEERVAHLFELYKMLLKQ